MEKNQYKMNIIMEVIKYRKQKRKYEKQNNYREILYNIEVKKS